MKYFIVGIVGLVGLIFFMALGNQINSGTEFEGVWQLGTTPKLKITKELKLTSSHTVILISADGTHQAPVFYFQQKGSLLVPVASQGIGGISLDKTTNTLKIDGKKLSRVSLSNTLKL